MATDYGFILGKKYAMFKWSLSGDDYTGLNWMDDSAKPTQAELDKDYIDYKSANDYLDSRIASYPSVSDQLMMLFADIGAGKLTTAGSFYTAINAVHIKFPVPSVNSTP